MKKIIALILSVIMLLSCTVIYADETITETVVANAETEKEIPRVIGTFEEKNTDRTILYVATDGSDKNIGTIESPFASITKARDTIRAMKSAGTLGSGGAVVYIRGGEYTVTEGVEFTAEDSGTEGAPVIYRSYPDEKVDFIGAISIPWDKFEPVTDSTILNKIVDETARKNIVSVNLKSHGLNEFPIPKLVGPYSYWTTVGENLAKYGIKPVNASAAELVINDRTMTVARYPNEGHLTIESVPEPGTNVEPFTPFTITIDDDRVKYWTSATEAILTGTWQYSWGTSSTFLGEVNPENNKISSKYATWHRPTVGQQFHIYNLMEEIDVPGEYYIDRASGILYLYSLAEEVKDVKYTVLEDTMFTFKGAEYVTLKDVGMKYMRYRPFNIDGNSKHCSIEGCDISYACYNSSFGGLDNKVLDCNFQNTEGGVQVYGGDRETLTHANNLVENCTFEAVDRLSASHVYAVTIEGVGNSARHNLATDSVTQLFLLSGNDNLIEYNEISEACKNTDDAGALYSGRNVTHRGNIIRYNYFHDIGGADRGNNGCHGVFLDDNWSAADVVGNVFADITGAGCMAAGSHNVFSNNMFINCGESLRIHPSDDYGTGTNRNDQLLPGIKNSPFIYNDIWVKKYPTIVNVVDENDNVDMGNYIEGTNNVMYNTPEPSFSDHALKTAIVDGNVSFSKDPGFYDLLGKNYLLKPDSEVYEKIPDFVEIPFTRMGIYSDRATARVKKAYVYCLESPYTMKNGKIEKGDKVEPFVENGTVYISLRSGAEAVDATVDFNEETNEVTVASDAKSVSFTSGASLDAVNVNGADYTLEKPIIINNYTNYISLTDLVNIFEKYLVQKGGISVISNIENLFIEGYDDELLRYIEAQLTVY